MANKKGIQLVDFSSSTIINQLNAINTSISQVTTGMSQLNKNIKKTGSQSPKEVNKLSSSFANLNVVLSNAADVARFTLIYRSFRYLMQMMGEATSSLVEFQDALVDLRRISGMSAEGVNELSGGIVELARSYRIALNEAVEITRIWVQQGRQGEQLNRLMSLTAMTMKGLSISAAEATNSITILREAFGISIDQLEGYLDKIKAVESANAVMAKDLVQAYQRASGAAVAMGVNIDSVNGYVTALTQTLRVSGNYAGNFLKVIMMTVRRPNFQRVLEEVGIASKDTFESLGDVESILALVANRWEDLNSQQRQNIAFAAGGRRRYAEFMSLMNNFDMSVKASRDSMLAFNDVHDAAAVSMESFASNLQDSKTAMIEMLQNLRVDESLKGLVTTLRDVSSAIANMTEGMTTFKGVVVGLGTILAAVFAPLIAGKVGTLLAGSALVKGALGKGALTSLSGLGTGKLATSLSRFGIFTGMGVTAYSYGLSKGAEQEIEIERQRLEEIIGKRKGFSESWSRESERLAILFLQQEEKTADTLLRAIKATAFGAGFDETATNEIFNQIQKVIDRTENIAEVMPILSEKFFKLLVLSGQDEGIDSVKKALEDTFKQISQETEGSAETYVSQIRETIEQAISNITPKSIGFYGRLPFRTIFSDQIDSIKEIQQMFSEMEKDPEAMLITLERVEKAFESLGKDTSWVEGVRKAIEELRLSMESLSETGEGLSEIVFEEGKKLDLNSQIEEFLRSNSEEISSLIRTMARFYADMGMVPDSVEEQGKIAHRIMEDVIARLQTLGYAGAMTDDQDAVREIFQQIAGMEAITAIEDRAFRTRMQYNRELRNSTSALYDNLRASNEMLKLELDGLSTSEEELKIERLKIRLRDEEAKLQEEIIRYQEQIGELADTERVARADQLKIMENNVQKRQEELEITQKISKENIDMNRILKERAELVSSIEASEARVKRLTQPIADELKNLQMQAKYKELLEESGEMEAELFKINFDLRTIQEELLEKKEEQIERQKELNKYNHENKEVLMEIIAENIKDIEQKEALLEIIREYRIAMIDVKDETEEVQASTEAMVNVFLGIPEHVKATTAELRKVNKELSEASEMQRDSFADFEEARRRYLATGSPQFREDMRRASESISSAGQEYNSILETQRELNSEMNLFSKIWDNIVETIKTDFYEAITETLMEVSGLRQTMKDMTSLMIGGGSKIEVEGELTQDKGDIREAAGITGETIARVLVQSQIFASGSSRNLAMAGEIGGSLGLFGKLSPVAGVIGGLLGSVFGSRRKTPEAFTGQMGLPEVQMNTDALVQNTKELRKMNEQIINAPRGFEAPRLQQLSQSGQGVTINVSGFVGSEKQLAEQINSLVNESLTNRMRMA